ncbi:MAG: hypothetical protein IKO35_06025 [Elusimicrobiaceae bacterium]|nr:hypothetical protein [Elusimicrobiaceae bacterium]
MAEEKAREAAEKTLKDIERDELNLMIQNGVRFTVSRTVYRRAPGPLGFILPRRKETVTEAFVIQEPTLNTLDRMSEIWVDMDLPEAELLAGGAATLSAAKGVAHRNTKKMARVLAIAVLGEDYYYTIQDRNGRTREKRDDRELDRLTKVFMHSVKPSELVALSQTVTSVANLGDFIGSMRYMSGARTTQTIADRIE